MNGEGIIIFAVIAFGVVTPFVRGAGYLQLSNESTASPIYSTY